MTEAWLVLVNPRAGRGRRILPRVEDVLRRRKIPADIVAADGLEALREAVGRAAAEGRSRLAAAGGGGTVNAVLNAVLDHPWEETPVLGVLPAAGAGDLLRTFGIGPDLETAADRLAAGDVYPVDAALAVGEWGRRYFLNAAGAGLTAAAASAALRLPAGWGRFRYAGAAALALAGFRGGDIRLEADGRSFEGRAAAVILANGQFIGAGYNIAPRASMADGLLDVQVITSSRRRMGRLAARARGGNHLSDPGVRRYQAAEVRIEAEEPWPVEADGEPLGDSPLLVRVQAGRIALKV